ncbi:hypothetical protein A2865_02775 [Candidatus Woesebacteria bacterium RIFCSPHIGHO2_01_FULL_39_17]|uniref:DUF4349 domain-containing protein n=3 Tax=Candidatus Woeseibacteriota TaxID=1752722 RepID=A0A0G0NCR7_9BACT|nr:MAG: hypothetical protein US72_C0004G0066 [Microgenomates group bacterium GW2011_GWC1_38_12]KKQ93357.1 MAG: hypothetical protein UT19_C0013G0021 [Candidatus Woesebacteria bacterium GW2011_GWB1_39_10b]KKR13283.1 MAG: hypothetical protein UT40_C0020G0004 [Candidatus Woesebacteria bacterium GW2011_GWA1_39_21b]OGM23228.1 MAG: hypothetical protein A2865_02775 [Candidatus Woesebacteria bacterium RIFCSPHIGHO2_01_FULL_39_17]OGM61116.1 MAG: hypothetical protein A3A52_03960 [Candidatus Woesebacteria b
MKIIEWVKKNKLATILIVIVIYFLYRTFFGVNLLSLSGPTRQYKSGGTIGISPEGSFGAPSAGISLPSLSPNYQQDYTPQPDVKDRLVIQESNISLLVKDVVNVRNKILEYANSNGGYMVSSSTSSPEEAPYATVTIRVPSGKLQEALDYFHALSVKVVSENLVGRDVTDQYVDIDKRIATYEKTKAKYEEILDRATTITDITNLTREIISIQTQIDSLKGQQDALEKNAELAKLTIYLSTDEIALPYAPSETFRPGVIFKLAVRSLVGFARNLATLAIWIGVYAVIWVPALAIYIFVRNWLKKRRSESKTTTT